MVNLQGKESTALKTIQQSLEDNLNIIASDSRLKTIVDKIADSKYRIKDLSTITNVAQCNNFKIIDGKLFLLPLTINAGTIDVRDYQTDVLLKTISDGANAGTAGICFDDNYIYIAKCIQTITDRKYRSYYVRKYSRCTLDLIEESPILYTGDTAAGSTNSTNIFSMEENGDYLYLACIEVVIGENTHKIRKIKKSDFSLVSTLNWYLPLNTIKNTSGFFVFGGNINLSNDNKYRRIDFLDWDLNIIQTLPQTTLTNSLFRNGFYKDDFLYTGNDSGVLVKYQISTNTIIAEVQISEIAAIYSIMLINDNCILLQTNTSKIMLYDLNLNYIKMWDFYNTTTTGGYMIDDNNNTIWTQSASQPNTIYKKQFIDLSSGVM